MTDEQRELIKKDKEVIKSLWANGKEAGMSAKEIYFKLGQWFDIANWSVTDKGWLLFLRMTIEFNKEEVAERIKDGVQNFSEDQITEVQDNNRRRMILMLNEAIKKYEQSPGKMKSIGIEGLRRLYSMIQGLEEVKKRTEIQTNKLKLDAARTFLLPYQRMTVEELRELQSQLGNAINNIIKIKSEGPDDGTGQVTSGDGGE